MARETGIENGRAAPAATASPREAHEERRRRHEGELVALEARANRQSLGRLITFLCVVVLGITAATTSSAGSAAGGGVAALLFIALVVAHARTLSARELARARRDVHVRHLARIDGGWTAFVETGAGLLPADHPYAHDVDLVGPGSLFQRIDVAHTVAGARTLARWLGAAATPDEIAARAEAVRELAPKIDLRQELEASADVATGSGKLDPTPFLEFTRRPAWLLDQPALVAAIHVLPPTTIALGVLFWLGVVPGWAFGVPILAQGALFLLTSRKAFEAFDLVAARRGFAEAFGRLFATIESASFESSALEALRARLASDGVPPSGQMRALDRWAGFAELRTQLLFHFPASALLLWDLQVLYRLERWNQTAGRHLPDVFEAVGELEALSSFAGLHHGDPSTTFAEIVDGRAPFEADGLAHPLLSPGARVANDIALRGAGTALIVTGSNMAGKSTLLRAVGLGIALALAGGPVCARRMRAPRVRLRASMRADDDLQRGASYFHAELTKLKGVVADADGEPPVLFLLDELLRGTNAHARHIGARSILEHLLARGATGMVATHDVALSKLEEERSDRVANVHFTDVVENGEMTFDYRLKPGVVRTSNALRLLRMAGVDVPDDDGVGPLSP